MTDIWLDVPDAIDKHGQVAEHVSCFFGAKKKLKASRLESLLTTSSFGTNLKSLNRREETKLNVRLMHFITSSLRKSFAH